MVDQPGATQPSELLGFAESRRRPGGKDDPPDLVPAGTLRAPIELLVDLPAFQQVLELGEPSEGPELECLGTHVDPAEDLGAQLLGASSASHAHRKSGSRSAIFPKRTR